MGGKGTRMNGREGSKDRWKGRELCQICVLLMPGSKPGFCFTVGKVCVQVARPYFFYQNFTPSHQFKTLRSGSFIPVVISLSHKSE